MSSLPLGGHVDTSDGIGSCYPPGLTEGERRRLVKIPKRWGSGSSSSSSKDNIKKPEAIRRLELAIIESEVDGGIGAQAIMIRHIENLSMQP